MANPLNALIVEDSEDDTELLVRQLQVGGYAPDYVRVETGEAMQAELDSKRWQIVFSDFTMPRFNAFDALALLRKSGQDIPFIIVSGTIGEDRAVNAMKAGAHDYILKGNLKRLIPAVERELREAGVRQERKLAEETILKLAYVDPVTNLPNRYRFREFLQEAIGRSHGPKYLSLLLMDLERFKDVNDTLGHTRGDMMLNQVGMRLCGALPTAAIVARLGGDEFGILISGEDAPVDIKAVIHKLHNILVAPFMLDGIPIAVEASIGVANMPQHGGNADLLLQRADIAMYQAKRMASGYAVYDNSFDRHSPQRLGLLAELRDAIHQDQLVLHFQPKVDICDGCIVGTEALVRWQHPRHGLLMPEKFITSTEYTGLMMPLTQVVLTSALQQCQLARDKGLRFGVSVNLSARSLHNSSLPELVRAALNATGAQPDHLTLEVTESAIVLDRRRAEKTLHALHDLGVSLSIDDFGTGYTSLASIKRLPVDEIKIDKSFVANMLNDKNDAMIVHAVIDLGHNLGQRVVAEGVESQEMLDALRGMGCDEVQGYWVSRPLEHSALEEWVASAEWSVDSND